jgi:hypothetical protein
MRRRTTWSNPISSAYIGPPPVNPGPLMEALRVIRDGEAHRGARSLAHAYDTARQIASQALERSGA